MRTSAPRARAPRQPPNDAIRPALQQRSRDKRDLLIKAGIRAFARDGYDGARIADIAREAGISVGVFYQRFKDKRGFFTALETEFMRRGTENWDRFCDTADPAWTATELARRMIRNMGRVIARNEGFFRALVTLGHRDKSVFPPGREMDRHGANRVADLLAARGFIEDSPRLRERVYFTIACLSKVMVLTTLFGTEHHRATDEYSVEELAAMFLRHLEIGR